jgi:predicted PurR-regulated permease PerM
MILFYFLPTMPFTLNQFLLLLITIAVVVAITVFVMFIFQLRSTAKQGEETLVKLKELMANLSEISKKVNTKVDDLGQTLEATKKMAANLGEITGFFAKKIFEPSSKYFVFLVPLLRFAWRLMKKTKEDKHGKRK